MKEKRLTIRIHRPAGEIFDFTINPQNTPRWVDSIVEESVDQEEIGVGTHYTNKNREGVVNTYVVTQFDRNKMFEFKLEGSAYSVQYTFTPLSANETELEYFERDGEGLKDPFSQEVLEELKRVLESE